MSMTITLPEDWQDFVAAETAAGGFPSPAEYVYFLLAQAKLRKQAERVNALLEDGFNSGPATEWTAADLESIRREVHERCQGSRP